MKTLSRIVGVISLVAFVTYASGQNTVNVQLKTVSEQFQGSLAFADSSHIFLRTKNRIYGIPAENIDVIQIQNKVKVGKSAGIGAAVGAGVIGAIGLASGEGAYLLPAMGVGGLIGGLTGTILGLGGKYKHDVEVKGFTDRYLVLLPLLQKKSLFDDQFRSWRVKPSEPFVYDQSKDSLKSLKIPTYVFFEVGGGAMFTQADDQMMKAFAPFGGTSSFLFWTTTYPVDMSANGSFYLRGGVHIEPKFDVFLTYRKIGEQAVAGIGDFNFTVAPRNVSLVANYLFMTPDYFLSNRWKLSVGAGPAVNITESEVVLVGSFRSDPLVGILISSGNETKKESSTKIGFNIDAKADYYLHRNLYLTTSLEYIYSPAVQVPAYAMDLYAFNGALINPSSFNLSFGLGVNLF